MAKRKSLTELAQEDAQTESTRGIEIQPKDKKTVQESTKQNEKSKPKEESRQAFDKADYIKMSITVPPDMFDAIQDISRERRKKKEAYSMTLIVREAIEYWLENDIS